MQRPTCFRRLTGAALAGIVGPVVEPLHSPRQAAVRGGHCGPNILAAFGHLSRDRWTNGPAITGWWREFLGEAGAALEAYVESFPAEGIARVPAAVFADKSNASHTPGSWRL
jgi:hypothetical protein